MSHKPSIFWRNSRVFHHYPTRAWKPLSLRNCKAIVGNLSFWGQGGRGQLWCAFLRASGQLYRQDPKCTKWSPAWLAVVLWEFEVALGIGSACFLLCIEVRSFLGKSRSCLLMASSALSSIPWLIPHLLFPYSLPISECISAPGEFYRRIELAASRTMLQTIRAMTLCRPSRGAWRGLWVLDLKCLVCNI